MSTKLVKLDVRTSQPPLLPSSSRANSMFALVFAVAALSAAGCADEKRPPRTEDQARQEAPIPACIMRLPARGGDPSKPFVRNLTEFQYWELVFPEYDSGKKTLPQGAIPCTGRPVFNDALFNGGESPKGWPRPIEEGDIVYGSGGDRLKIVWLRTHRWSDETEAGPLALVRTKDNHAEVYAVGAYRGRTKKPYFGLERMGGEALVTAQDDGCTGNASGPCENTLTIFIPRAGQLRTLTVLTLEQRAYALGGEPGMPGRIEYRLTSSPTFTKTGISVVEQVKAKDESGRELRKAEQERVLTLRDNDLVESQEGLWGRIYPKQAAH